MSTPTFSVGGLASGLDTQGIVNQLLQLERQPVVRFQQRQTELRKVDEAWGQVTTKLSGLRAQVDKLKAATALSPTTLTSSDADAVTVKANGTARPGAVAFTVTRLATNHQVSAGGSFSSATATVGAGTFTLVRPDGTGDPLLSVAVDAGTTVEQLAGRINGAGAGFSAQAVKVAEGDVRLVVTATASGEAKAFRVGDAPTSVAATTVLTPGVDAKLQLGSLEVTRSGNTIDDLLPGARVQLRRTTAAPVTVEAKQDTAAAVATVKGLVDGLNGVLSTLKDLTAYDAANKKAKPLQGDDTARKLANDLRTAVSATVAGLTGFSSAGTVGISLDRHGAVTFAEEKFTQALAADPAAVAKLFQRSGTAGDPRVRYVSSTAATQVGAHTLEVTQAAQLATVTGASYSPPLGSPEIFTVTTGGRAVSVTIEADANLTTAVLRINQALRAEGVTTLVASEGTDGGGLPAISLAESRYGTVGTFSVSGSGSMGLDGTHAGTDIAGTIDGAAATGSGARLTATAGSGTGLAVEVTAADVTNLGGVTVTGGLNGALERVLRWAEGDRTSVDPNQAVGAVGRARKNLTDEIRRFDTRISEFEVRLVSREKTLRGKFSALESAMQRLQGQGNWLAGQFGGG